MRVIPGMRTVWRQQSLAREITLVLMFKIVMITLLWWMFFHVPDTLHIDTPQVSAHVVGTPPHYSEAAPK